MYLWRLPLPLFSSSPSMRAQVLLLHGRPAAPLRSFHCHAPQTRYGNLSNQASNPAADGRGSQRASGGTRSQTVVLSWGRETSLPLALRFHFSRRRRRGRLDQRSRVGWVVGGVTLCSVSFEQRSSGWMMGCLLPY